MLSQNRCIMLNFCLINVFEGLETKYVKNRIKCPGNIDVSVQNIGKLMIQDKKVIERRK